MFDFRSVHLLFFAAAAAAAAIFIVEMSKRIDPTSE